LRGERGKVEKLRFFYFAFRKKKKIAREREGGKKKKKKKKKNAQKEKGGYASLIGKGGKTASHGLVILEENWGILPSRRVGRRGMEKE